MSKRNDTGLLVPHPSILIPSAATPPTPPAFLAVYAWGPNKPEAARAILELAEKPATELVRIEVDPPFRTQLPGVHYEIGHPLVQALKDTGCRFSITCFAWTCPIEDDPVLGDRHRCSPKCSVMLIEETFDSHPEPGEGRLLTW